MPLLTTEQIAGFIPAFKGRFGQSCAGLLRKVLGVSKLSDYYDAICDDNKGADFAGALLRSMEVDYKISGAGKLRNLPEGPFITVSNHPYGTLDGIVLIDLMGHLRPEFKVMVNQFLSIIEAMSSSMIVVNPKTASRNSVTAVNLNGVREVLARIHDGHPVGFFPAGAVSDLHLKDRRIYDREWQDSVIRLIKKARVPIVPIRFFGRNSLYYYLLGLIDWRVRVLRLPRELVNKKGSDITIGIGDTISVEQQKGISDLAAYGQMLRDAVYGMQPEDDLVSYSEFIKGA